jgi:succinate dehydrogenase / fumarate reductase cytochrome b subunit
MGWFIKFIDSSVGKKLVMALTGLFLYLFLIEHLIANLLLLGSDNGKAYEIYADVLGSSYNIPLRIIEVGLFICIVYHALNGTRLWLSNNKAKGQPYLVNNASENSTFFSRFMFWDGLVVGIFLVIHLKSFFVNYRLVTPEDTMYEGVVKTFTNPYYSIFYLFAFVLLAFHLVHGFQSAFQTLGLRHNKYTPFIKGFGVSFSILICAGFAILPIYFLFFYGRV